jgi:1,4-dihydroxy-6-naphthoate synthase
MRELHLGISPCPNDTWVFHGLLRETVKVAGCHLKITLADIEELNRGLRAQRFDVAKASFAAVADLAESHVLLPAGAALGIGVGPVLLARDEASAIHVRNPRVLLPGENTTATLLWRAFHGDLGAQEKHVSFDQIMPMLAAGSAELGVCIHEGRFTWQERGFHLMEDLGARFEARFKLPLPLGGLFARKDLGSPVHRALTEAIRRSMAEARAHPLAALKTQRAHAQELDDAVIRKHVNLYVNSFTENIGTAGMDAVAGLATLMQKPLPPLAEMH